jgi:hypothetical protein
MAIAAKATVNISAPNMLNVETMLIGTAPLMIARFSAKAMQAMLAKHVAGPKAKKGSARVARDLDADFEGARHISHEGWDGIHAGAFRAAMISACRLVGFKMTLAKLSLFVRADGNDRVDHTPLVRIISAKPPQRSEMPVRNATGVMDIRIRPVWPEWAVKLHIRFDGDQFSHSDVLNLLARVGEQVGIGEGRPDSRDSAGIGFGTFRLQQEGEADAVG